MTVLARQILFSGLVLIGGTPVGAQEPAAAPAAQSQAPAPALPPSAAPATPSSSSPVSVDPRKPSVLSFETNLREAVDLAGQRMSERAYQIAPVQIVQMRAATVRGVPLEGFGYHFDVQIPGVLGSGLALLEMALKSQQMMPSGPVWAPSARPVSQTQAGDRTSVSPASPDPMVKPPVTEASLNSMYTNFVKEALIDAILDTAGVLILVDTEKLAVTASGDDVITNQLQRLNNRQLVLTIKGVDLNALRSGRINRDQARDRIVVQAF
jgi:hypothetical protein